MGSSAFGHPIEPDLADPMVSAPDRASPIGDDAEEPRDEPIRVAQAGQSTPRLDEGILDHVRGLRFAGDRDGQPIGRRRVRPDELLEGIDVSAPCPHDGVQVPLPPYLS